LLSHQLPLATGLERSSTSNEGIYNISVLIGYDHCTECTAFQNLDYLAKESAVDGIAPNPFLSDRKLLHVI